MDLFQYIACVFGTFGISQIITKYDGPFHLLLRLREKRDEFECYVCVSVWVGFLLTFFLFAPDPFRWGLLFWSAAVIGGAYLLNKVVK